MISTLKAMATVPGDVVWGAKSARQRFGLREPRTLKAEQAAERNYYFLVSGT